MKKALQNWTRSFVDIHPGEGRRAALMFLYYLLVLFAYYILKPVSRALFLDKFDADKLPWLYILMALLGGTGASWISRAATRSRLTDVIGKAQIFLIGNILLIWWLLQYQSGIVLFLFSIWVGSFSVITVGQFWLLANNLFDARSARRMFSLIGLAAVLGGVLGGTFTSMMVHVMGSRHLMLVCGFLVALNWVVVRLLRKEEEAVPLPAAAEMEYRFRDTLRSVWGVRHLRAISFLVGVMFVVDTLVDYQFSVMAKGTYQDAHLVAFLARFQGIYLNVLSFLFQLFLTRPVLRYLGVGGALGFAPLAVAAGSVGFLAVPSMLSVGITRAVEAATRYTFTRTGLEMLYLPVPRDLKNRTKIFLEVFVDRVSRGTAGGLLLFCTSVLALKLWGITVLTLGFVGAWIVIISVVLRSYVGTLKQSIEKRQVHMESVSVNPSDAATVGILLRSLDSPNERQVAYALSLLEQAPQVSISKRLPGLLKHPSADVRTATLRLLASRRDPAATDEALGMLRDDDESLRVPAVNYLCQCAPAPQARLQEFLNSDDLDVRLAAVIAAEEYSYPRPLPAVSQQWIRDLLSRPPSQAEKAHALAARALALADPELLLLTDDLRSLLADSNPAIANAALRAAGEIRSPYLVPFLLRSLGKRGTRAQARAALISYGSPLVETLGEYMNDPGQPDAVRENLPRVLAQVATPNAARLLVQHLPNSTVPMRFQILKALNRMRRDYPEMPIPGDVIDTEILSEARRYCELLLSIESDTGAESGGRRLLIRSLEQSLDQTLERIFRLLGLRYPPEEIYDAYRAVRSPESQRRTAALEFLDNTLGQPLRRMILPILEERSWERLEPLGEELFGMERLSSEECLRQLVHGDDRWLKIVAMHRAGELQGRSLEPDIHAAEADSDPFVAETARQALSRIHQQAA